ncbi:bifunctional RNase H/acid phosphatase [Phytoactinopolyspora alkaliphila]|uniref:Bifunctional RNase H/acid phosphatase n=1 Tax=Phytoactinopolyspora alkaliphila TaxID=1783498 RepID=A0A6N9YNP7_9ACTN|nr:bifunctional RNase H/acid phosphatase [Phytoactinopolyspora alkaliphila]NED96565.1 bifunctional RNase H/acid phosphatase [Phytoactinopolyspora alkaliphila]
MTRLIVEADGGSRGNPGPAAFGALVRSADTGEVLAEAGETIGVATNNVAEYRGLIAGLRMARQIDPSAQVEARLDSKLVVEQMSGRWKIKHPGMRPLALEAQRILPPGQVTYTWVPRAQNAHADRLLNDALDGKPVAPHEAAEHPDDDAPALPTEPEPFDAKTEPETATTPDTVPPPHRLVTWSPELGPPTTLVVVRHGQTAMTRARAFSGGGTEGPPLDEVGLDQALRAGTMLAGSDVMADVAPVVVASPMLRTRQTADAIATQLGVEKVGVDDEWRECEFGAWDGLTLGEITERYPEDIAAWFASTSYQMPGGESLDQMTARIVAARDRTVELYAGRTVVVVTHSMPVRALVRLALEAPASAMFKVQPAPGSVTEIQHYSDGTVALAGFNTRP